MGNEEKTAKDWDEEEVFDPWEGKSWNADNSD
eukprot:CAMPEP_0182445674 /NCGR_PEP_ID=MMETSP1172-20130603/3721_1 /TAXON_ID=708627 /ORGANISM="Timspurckia oligopyrenoides, Strain CCMP3278" /LENGTH=31 /DNA_ID= /DNA_START= /DNA_END= /DNA_ORIENTATION=